MNETLKKMGSIRPCTFTQKPMCMEGHRNEFDVLCRKMGSTQPYEWGVTAMTAVKW